MMRSTFTALAALMALGAATPTAFAQGEASAIKEPYKAMPHFSVSMIGALLDEVGVGWQVVEDTPQSKLIYIELGDIVAYLQPTVCSDDKCIGLSIQAMFEGYVNPQTVQSFNARYPFVSTGLMPQSRGAYISRYEMADFGIARGNFLTSLVNFEYSANMFLKELSSSSQTVSLEGHPDDLSARFLNAQALGGLKRCSCSDDRAKPPRPNRAGGPTDHRRGNQRECAPQ